ncbi:MAG: AI-2E family transporter [Bilophila wadsworthia]
MTRVLACLAIGAWVFLLWPFPITTFMATCMACVTYPAYRKLHRKMSPSWAMTTYTVGLAAITILPIATVVSLVTPQAVAGLKILDGLRDSGWIHSPEAQAWFASVDAWLKNLPGLEGGLDQLASTAAGLAGTAARTVLAGGVGIAGGAFQAVLVLFLFVMITMMCVTRADLIHEFACRLTQWPAEVIDRFVSTIRKAIFGVLVGVVFVALIQGFLCGVGFAIAEVPQPAFWASLPRSWLPSLCRHGSRLLPVCIWLWLTGSTVACIGLAIWCALVVAGVDNLLRPFFLKTGIDASVVTLILSILCGLAAFGPVGVFAGPVLVAVAIQAGNESTLCRKH